MLLFSRENMDAALEQTILIVDDDADVRHVLAEILECNGFKVLGAPTGEIALEILRKTPVTLVVVDIGLTGENGGELELSIRKILPEVKIMYISGYPIKHNYKAPFLKKPFTISEIVSKVREILKPIETSR